MMIDLQRCNVMLHLLRLNGRSGTVSDIMQTGDHERKPPVALPGHRVSYAAIGIMIPCFTYELSKKD